MIAQLLHLYLPAQRTAQVMVYVAKEAVVVTLDGTALIVQFQSQKLPAQTIAQVMVYVVIMAVFVT